LPRLRGTEQGALSPFLAQPYIGEREMFVPISSTNTTRRASSGWATITLQADLSHSSRSSAPTVRFFGRSRAASLAALRWSRSYTLRLCAPESYTSLVDGGAWALLHILLQEGLGFLVYYAGSSGALFRGEGLSLSDTPSVRSASPRRGSRRRCGLPQPWTYPALRRRLSSCADLRNRLSCVHDRIQVNLYAHRCRSAIRLLKTASETRRLRHRSASLPDLPSAIFFLR
jgi:hypothetical protein